MAVVVTEQTKTKTEQARCDLADEVHAATVRALEARRLFDEKRIHFLEHELTSLLAVFRLAESLPRDRLLAMAARVETALQRGACSMSEARRYAVQRGTRP